MIMSELLPQEAYYNHSPSHQERASVYIGDTMSAEDREAASSIAGSFIRADKPMADTAVLIPVAAHQDGDSIVPAMAEYAQQKTDKPFTVFLHLNAPLNSSDITKVEAAEANVVAAQQLFPHLDIRSNTTYYDNPTIGKIRKDLWNASFLLAYHEHGFSNDVIGINHDIDVHKISPHYIARVQQYYERRANQAKNLLGPEAASQVLQKPIATRVVHALLPSHPNTGKVTTWVDNTFFQAPDHVAYEAGLVVPFSNYAYLFGFNEDSKTHETAWISGQHRNAYLSGAQLYTSPRRYIDRLHDHTTEAIWTDDSFGPDDPCRNALRADISGARAEEIILDRLHEDIMHHWLPGVMKPIYEDIEFENILGTDSTLYISQAIETATTKVEQQLAKASRMLRRVIGSDILADLVQSSYDPAAYAKTQVTGMHEVLNDPDLIKKFK